MSDAIQAVFFDLGNTLVHYYKPADFAPILRESIVGISGELQRRGFPQDRNRLLERAWSFNLEREDHRVWPLTERLRELLGPPAGDPALMPQIVALFLRPIFRMARPDPGAGPTLAELRRRGIRTAILSNTPWGSSAGSWRADLERLGLASAADATLFCTDVGWRKPAPALFERALLQLGVEAGRTLMVGDDLEADIGGARRLGMQAILFDPRGEYDDDIAVPTLRRLADVLDLISEDMPHGPR